MHIKKATIEDVYDISQIYAASWKVAFDGLVSKNYLENLKDDHWIEAFTTWIGEDILIADLIYDQTKPVGCIAYGKSRDLKLPQYGEIASFYLLPEYFGKGFGNALIKNVFKYFEANNFENIFLWVLDGNTRARRFYEKIGFIPTEEILECFIDGEKLIDYRYIYKIK